MTETDGQEELQRYLGGLSFKVRRKLVEAIKREADRLAEAIKAAAPVRTGALRDSIRVRRRRGDLDLVVTAGGDATTKFYSRSTDYAERVVIDGRSNQGIEKRSVGEGFGVSYDYSLAIEFGATDHPAEPFFYSTYRQMQDSIVENIQKAVEEALNA